MNSYPNSVISPQGEHIVVDRTASVGADVEVRAMLLDFADDFLRARTTVGSEAIHTDAVGFQ